MLMIGHPDLDGGDEVGVEGERGGEAVQADEPLAQHADAPYSESRVDMLRV
jgi:hypothetical protein